MKEPYDPDWAEAKRRCRLNEEEVAMAKELGFRPKSLIKNVPASSEQWKVPAKQWVRALYDKRFGARRPAGAPRTAPAPHAARKRVVEFRNPEYPWPDHHQVDVHIFDAGSGEYRGRLCIFGQCRRLASGSAAFRVAAPSRSYSSSRDIGSVPRDSMKRRASFCTTGNPRSWSARREWMRNRPYLCAAREMPIGLRGWMTTTRPSEPNPACGRTCANS